MRKEMEYAVQQLASVDGCSLLEAQLRLRTAMNCLAAAGYAVVPVEPSPGLLASMAMRYRHDFGIRRADSNPFPIGLNDSERASLISTMGKLHQEVVGIGFYAADKEDDYAMLAAPAQEPEA